MADHLDFHTTSQYTMTWEGCVQTFDSPDVHLIVETTNFGRPAASGARVSLWDRLEGGFQVPNALSVDQIMDRTRKYVR